MELMFQVLRVQSTTKPSRAIGLTYSLGKGAKPFEMTKLIKLNYNDKLKRIHRMQKLDG